MAKPSRGEVARNCLDLTITIIRLASHISLALVSPARRKKLLAADLRLLCEELSLSFIALDHAAAIVVDEPLFKEITND